MNICKTIILKYIKKNIALLYFIFILKNLYIFYWIEIWSEERLMIQYSIKFIIYNIKYCKNLPFRNSQYFKYPETIWLIIENRS